MNIDILLANAAVILEIALSIFLIRSKFYKTLPFFSFYVVESVFTNPIMTFLYLHITSRHYLQFFELYFTCDSILQILIIVEVSLLVFKPFLKLIPKFAVILLFIVFFSLMFLLSWAIFARHSANIIDFSILYFYIRNMIAISRVAVFFSVISLSRVLAINWRSRKMQIATGFGVYAIAFLLAVFIHSYQITAKYYLDVDRFPIVIYLLALVYWIISFSRAEPAPKIFTPEMRDSLTLLAHNIQSDDPSSALNSVPSTDPKQIPK